jgi:predicted short-subunit dehydrogenase-like oxidoreductase (DUF2520 family)
VSKVIKCLRLGKSIVRDLEGKSFSIRSEDKPLYHAAAVMVSGNVVALFDVRLEMLGQCGLKRENSAQAILLPLIASTVRNLETKDPGAGTDGNVFARRFGNSEAPSGALKIKNRRCARSLSSTRQEVS